MRPDLDNPRLLNQDCSRPLFRWFLTRIDWRRILKQLTEPRAEERLDDRASERWRQRTDGVQESPEQRELNDKIDAWHNGAGDGKPLHEFLGMTREEFARRVAGAHGVKGPDDETKT